MTKVFATISLRLPAETSLRLAALSLLAFTSAAQVLAFTPAALAQAQAPVIAHRHGMGNTGIAPPSQMAAQQPSATGKAAATIPAATSTTPVSTEPVSQLQEPPKQAVIETQANNLTIRADNASLTQTLQRIADKTGMQLDGVTGDQRVFGNFGPGAPRDVLGTLLNGTGYNIVMIGALANGAPRQLILSQKKADQSKGQSASAPSPQQTFAPVEDDSGDPPPDDQPPATPPPHGGPDGTGPGIRTPQQMLQQMQQMRQQADQQQAAPPQ